MKKSLLINIGLGLLQHIIAAFIFMICAFLLFNSYLTVESLEGNKTYKLDPLNAESQFEDSDLFRDIFQTAVTDVTKLVVIRNQVETDGVFDPRKHIDVTAFASRKSENPNCKITAVYELDDLIRWGKIGVFYYNRVMSLSDFVNYFGSLYDSRYFGLDENGELYFKGFSVENNEEPSKYSIETVDYVISTYSEEQLEDMVLSYILSKNGKHISLSREEDGSFSVNIHFLSCKYPSLSGEKHVISLADNWLDYFVLQENIEEAIITLTNNYEAYKSYYELYEANNSNVSYAVRMMTHDGLRTYSNVPEIEGYADNALSDYFGEIFNRYMVYYPDSLEFIGNSNLDESDIFNLIQESDFAYPESTHIWVGVDTQYPVNGDAFFHANQIYNQIVPNVRLIMIGLGFLLLFWIMLTIYFSVVTGTKYLDNGTVVHSINHFDKIWTEFFVLLWLSAFYFVYRVALFLKTISERVYISHQQFANTSQSLLKEYGCYALAGFLISLIFAVLWYSLVRRLKVINFWRYSFVHWIYASTWKLVNYILNHKSSAISVLLPYNLFLLFNFLASIGAYLLRERTALFLICLLGLVVVDGITGVLLFKQNADKFEIIEAIHRIRDGEVDHKVDVSGFQGANRDIGDAVNNIGDGLGKALRTSVKDEKLKADLITNVSHDIKTPLTSIISYVDLLKRLKIQESPAKEYIEVLDSKSQRLKQLTDDLVEVSKISSGNITLNMEILNLSELIQQTLGEFCEKLEEAGLTVVVNASNPKAYIYADSRRMWRVIENLFNNVCKYSMENTRVFVDLSVAENRVNLSIKNTSRRQMDIQADDLTERFIRGDSSRSTEGSGLGLSIAKSLTQAQGGTFEIQLEGDLFKVYLSFELKEYPAETEVEQP